MELHSWKVKIIIIYPKQMERKISVYWIIKVVFAFAKRPRVRFWPKWTDLASKGSLILFYLINIPKVCLQTSSFWNTIREHVFLHRSSMEMIHVPYVVHFMEFFKNFPFPNFFRKCLNQFWRDICTISSRYVI